MSKKIVFYSGLPGSGKTSAAQKLVDENGCGEIFTTDDFFMVGDDYKFSFKFISAAHKWNLGRVALAMFHGVEFIVVPNTNLQAWEILPYLELAVDSGYEVEILEPKTKWKNKPEECFSHGTHGVPLETIKKMADKKQSVKDMMDEATTKLARLGKNIIWAE